MPEKKERAETPSGVSALFSYRRQRQRRESQVLTGEPDQHRRTWLLDDADIIGFVIAQRDGHSGKAQSHGVMKRSAPHNGNRDAGDETHIADAAAQFTGNFNC